MYSGPLDYTDNRGLLSLHNCAEAEGAIHIRRFEFQVRIQNAPVWHIVIKLV
ncbi:uncharacterized protein PHALS_04417 [Plasmopara halstedii]|uniref:Uncharacterized protein n=1 Tax=Plasmopara halstedii TaxID=4781 RepID=A0A0P1B0X2_PLAHL|nr:uncharacterized protein PHALS_04417 [Plasmopara halstedii]CEG47549.1 hypothetical protein PHALS_04417 [Plasmopara halstedii]|eukprot:XP_024583918.1 hypothetical protein PHALS_04417 [Plasmopara halstedii]